MSPHHKTTRATLYPLRLPGSPDYTDTVRPMEQTDGRCPGTQPSPGERPGLKLTSIAQLSYIQMDMNVYTDIAQLVARWISILNGEDSIPTLDKFVSEKM